jgi:hypothetical protein
MKKLWIVLALVLAVATGVYGASVASAGKGHGGKGGTVHGTVTATTANTITLTTFHKCASDTINTTSSTKIIVNHKAGTLADIHAGDVATVKLAKDGSATSIHDRSAKNHSTLRGKVAAVDTTNNTITITLKKTCADVTVPVTSKTKIRRNGKKATLADIKVGDRAQIKLNKDGSARHITDHGPKS